MGRYSGIQDLAYEANMELYRNDLVVATFGNVSALDQANGVFAIKPSGVSYKALKPRDMVVVDLQNKIIEGKLKPSCDTRTHAVLYRHFPAIGGVAHTHSTYAVAWAQAQKPIPIFGTTHADHLTCDIPCTKVMTDTAIKGDYEEETGNLIADHFKKLDYKEIEMVLVACHGPFTWGESAAKAVYNACIVEELAAMACLTLQINPAAPPLKKTLIKKHYERKHGKNAYYGQH